MFKKTIFPVLIITSLMLIVSFSVFFTSKSDYDECTHFFGDWELTDKKADGIYIALCRECSLCGHAEYKDSEITGNIPVISFSGNTDNIGKNAEVTVNMKYAGPEQSFSCVATLEYQGALSLCYNKKNFNVRLYKDLSLKKRFKVSFLDWGSESKYCLKANFIDSSHSRNIVSARLWGDICASRSSPDPDLSALTNSGAVDGFPVVVFINGDFTGLYTLNIPKDEWAFGIDGSKENQAVVFASNWESPCLFRAETDCVSDWNIVYASGDDTEWAKDSLNRLISFVTDNEGEDFAAGIGRYLDVDAAIDYMILMYYACFEDNFAKNMLLVTYDGVKWIPSFYDLDTAFGLFYTGTSFFPYDEFMPSIDANDATKLKMSSLLWERLYECCSDRIKERYSELRGTVLNEKYISSLFSDFISQIPDVLYGYDAKLYPDIPNIGFDHIGQISTFIENREPLLDGRFK